FNNLRYFCPVLRYDRLSNDEGVVEVRYQRGVSFNSQEKLGAARTQFENVINNPRANKYQQIRALLQISSACSSEGKTDCAEEFASKAITLAKEERMENIATNGLINLGNAFLARGEYDKAEQNFQQGLDFARKDEGFRNEARALLTLGSLRIQQKKPDEAQSFVNQALSFFQKGGYNKEVSQANLILGRASEMKEDYDAALQAFQQVENSETAPVADKAYAKMVNGNVLKHQEKYPKALRILEQSYDLYQSLNNPFYTTYTLFYLSHILFQLGRFEEAKDKLFKAQAILKKGDSLYPQLSTETHLLNARIALSGRNFTEAIKEAKQDSLSKDPSVASDANMIIGLAQTSSNPKNPEGIKKCIEALENAVSTKDTRAINTTKLALAEAYLNTGNYSDALETALQSKNYFITAGQLESGWRALVLAGKAKQQKGDGENARIYATNALEILHQLQSDWGQEHFNNYLSKPDNNLYFKQAQGLSKSE
ncbi:MAG: tetratricopeptide repeat protein, partial [Segetibacter sp.]